MKILIAVITMMSSFAWAFPIIPTTVAYIESSPAHSYWASSPAFPPPATPSDVCSMFGSGTKMVKVYKVRVSTTQTTAGYNKWFVVKRSSANLSGTSVYTGATTAAFSGWQSTPSDSAELVASASAAYWLANPTQGTSVGYLRSVSIPAPAPGTVTAPAFYEFDFGPTSGTRAIVLRNINEGISLSFGGAALPTGLSVQCEFAWTEENF